MEDAARLYVDGGWPGAKGSGRIEFIDPSIEGKIGQSLVATETEVGEAVATVRTASETLSNWSLHKRKEVNQRGNERLKVHNYVIASRFSLEMGTPKFLLECAQE